MDFKERKREKSPLSILLWIVSSILNNFLSPGGFVQCAFLGSFWPLIMHSCIHLYNAQHCGFIGQIYLVWTALYMIHGWRHLFLLILLRALVFSCNSYCAECAGPEWVSEKSHSHLNKETELIPPRDHLTRVVSDLDWICLRTVTHARHYHHHFAATPPSHIL